MDKDKSIIEKITDKMKDIAEIAADAANYALKAEEPPLKADNRTASYMPLAADGLVSDPMMVPPLAAAPVRKRKRAAPKRAGKAAKTRGAKRAAKKPGGRAVKKPSAAQRSRQDARTIAKKRAGKSVGKARKAGRGGR
jgi:hypothetical protein